MRIEAIGRSMYIKNTKKRCELISIDMVKKIYMTVKMLDTGGEFMRIEWDNKEEVDNLYIHDSYIKEAEYFYDKRKINLTCEYFFDGNHKQFRFTFNNVIFAEVQSCRFWGKSSKSRVSVIYFDKENNSYKELCDIQNNGSYKFSYLNCGIKYLPIVIETNSGDVMTIVCESMDYEEHDLCMLDL